ncbi:hypothetical protein GCM10023347_05170 [Streptomyces chumphonensis]
MGGDLFGGALAAAQSGGDQVVGVAAVGLGAGGAPGGAAVVAADEQVPGGQGGRVEVVQDGADLTGGRVETVFGAVAVEPDGPGAPAEGAELPDEAGQLPVPGETVQLRGRGSGVTGDDGLLLVWLVSGEGLARRGGGCLAVSRPPRRALSGCAGR